MRIGVLSRRPSLYSSPDLEGIEEATGVDVAAEIIEFIENHADETS